MKLEDKDCQKRLLRDQHTMRGLAAIASALFVIGSAYSLGRAVTRRNDIYCLAAGSGLLSLCIYALALSGLAKASALGVLGGLALASSWNVPRPQWRRPSGEWLAILPFATLYISHAIGPEIQPDAAGYHLGLTAEWLRSGKLPDRAGFYEVLPQGMEMLFGMAMAFGGMSAAKLVHLAFFFACLPLIRQLSGSTAAAALFFFIPLAAVSGASAYTDVAQVFFLLAALGLLTEERALESGFSAGMAYAAKITGLLAIPVLGLWLAIRGEHRRLPAFLVGAAAVVIPWMGRAVWLAQNPLAPASNRLFPNDVFHPGTDAAFSASVNAGLPPWSETPWVLAVEGFRLQGLFGPVFLFVPLLALAAGRDEKGRRFLIASLVFMLPWLMNPGARFLLPGAAFACLAVGVAWRPRILWPLAVLHAVLALPPVMDRYTHPQAWRLRGWTTNMPEGYLDAVNLVKRHVPPSERLLTLHGVPFAYLDQVPLGPYSSREFDQVADTLFQAAGKPSPRVELNAAWPLEFARAVRVRCAQPDPQVPWSVIDMQPQRASQAIAVQRNWFVDAWPVPGWAPLAADQNIATRWQTWLPSPAGAYAELRFDRPVPLDGVAVLLENYEPRLDVQLYVQDIRERWSPRAFQVEGVSPSLPRKAAGAYLRARGLSWVLVKDGVESFDTIGQALRMAPEAWGVEPVGRADNVWLFRVR